MSALQGGYTPESVSEVHPAKVCDPHSVDRWVSLIRDRSDQIGNSAAANTGEEFTTCGDLRLDGEVAKFVLEPVRSRLPEWGYRKEDGSLFTTRPPASPTATKLRAIPLLLFSVNWADSGPGYSWPEAYYVTPVPELGVRIVTASVDCDEIWGCTDLAIGMCRSIGRPEWGTKKIIASWWRRGCGIMRPWDMFWSPGLISGARARQWRSEVFGSLKKYE
jgi:hypothetical protein